MALRQLTATLAASPAVVKRLTLYRGEDVTLTVTPDPPIDITGWGMSFAVADADDNILVAKATGGSGIDVSGGDAVVTIDATETLAVPGRYLWTLSRTDLSEAVVVATGAWQLLDTAGAGEPPGTGAPGISGAYLAHKIKSSVDEVLEITGGVIKRTPGYLLQPAVAAEAFGAVGDGVTDDQPALQQAVTALDAAGGGLLLLQPTKQYKFASTLSFAGCKLITVTTGGCTRAGLATQVPQPANLLFTGGGSGKAVNLANSQSIKFVGLQIRYSSSSFTGVLLDTDNGGAGGDAGYLELDGCALGGTTSSAKNAHALLRLNYAITSTIKATSFEWADYAIHGPQNTGAGYGWANQVTISHHCTFRALNNQTIYNMGEAWVIAGNTFEANVGSRCTWFDDDGVQVPQGITISGNWMGDVNSGTDYAIRGQIWGLTVTGNFSSGNSSGMGFVSLKAGSRGVFMAGNHVSFTNGIRSEGAYAYGVLLGADYSNVTNWIVNPSNFAFAADLSNDTLGHEFFGIGSAVRIRDDGTIQSGSVSQTRDVLTFGHVASLSYLHQTCGPVIARASFAGVPYSTLCLMGSNASSGFTGAVSIFTGDAFGTHDHVERLRCDIGGNVIVGNTMSGDNSVSTSASGGFLYITTCPGAPTGSPTAYTGAAPLVYDASGDQLYLYNGAWQPIGGGNPGGLNTQVQFNNSGSFGGSANLTWDGSSFTANGTAITSAGRVVPASTAYSTVAGSVSNTTVFGLTLEAKTGTGAYSFSIFSGGNAIVLVPDGTVSWLFGSSSDVGLSPTKKLYLDGISNTYLQESSGDTVVCVAGGTTAWTATAAGLLANFKPAHQADGSAANDTIYFSTTAGKLVYKDSGGTVNNLY